MEKNLWKYIEVLYVLSKKGAFDSTIEITSANLGKEMGLSQQTASRRLQDLEKLGWISRKISRKSQYIQITDLGIFTLSEIYSTLRFLFEDQKVPKITIKGEVFSGVGEGAYYVAKPRYLNQFIEKLGFNPYLGTLNLRLNSPEDIKGKRDLFSYPGILIESWTDGERSYGSVRCFCTLINHKIIGAVLKTERTHYGNDVIEVISNLYLRERLGLKDGDEVTLTIYPMGMIDRK